MYGTEVSPALISSVTDAVIEEVKAWQARPLDEVYPIVHHDVKDEAAAYALAVVPARAYNAADVRAVLERLVREYGYPAYLRSDRGSEFMAADLREWLAANRIQPAYIDAGKPWQNGSSESFNGTLRRGCLNRYEFHGIEDATIRMEQWRRIYNEVRPHSRLGYRPPASAYFLERFQDQKQVA